MKKKDDMGMAFSDYEEHKAFLNGIKKLGMDVNDCLIYCRHTQFIPDGCPPCVICGGNKLVHGIGRYLFYDPTCTKKEDSRSADTAWNTWINGVSGP